MKKIIYLLFFVTAILGQSIDYDANPRYQQQQQQQPGYGQNYNSNNPNYNNNYNQQSSQNGLYNLAQQAGQRLLNNTLVNQAVGVVNKGLGMFNQTSATMMPGMQGIPPTTSGVRIKVQLQNYIDQGYKLSDTQLCVCPQGQSYESCVHNSPARAGYTCLFSFMVLINSADSQLRYDATSFLRIDNNYGVNQNERNEFQRTFEFVVQERPKGITVIVNHMGAVIEAYTGNINSSNTVVPVDRFTIPFDNNTVYGNPITKSVVGDYLQTQLTVAYTISCSNNSRYGPACNFDCTTSSINSQNAICKDAETGYYSVCRWQNSAIVTDCQNCPWGIKDNAYCQDENGGLLNTHTAGVVSSDWKTATIVLAIIAGVLFLLLAIGLIVSICIQRRNRAAANVNEVPPGYTRRNNELRGGHVGNPEATPLNAPNPQSALRTPAYQYPPAAHLGGVDSLNETLNSSFAGSQVPGNVSRSADV
uniref:Uncharacterized protein n=1 Tax=Panagrolaimus sp. ES5 TaxID=591445 RepID=A0AC34F7S4_9BILA